MTIEAYRDLTIVHLSMLYPPHIVGGAELSLQTLAEEQARWGANVTVVCSTPGPLTREVQNGVGVIRIPHGTKFWSEQWPEHSKIERFLRKLLMPFNRRFQARFGSELDSIRPNVVHTHSMVDVSTGCWRLASKRGYPVIHTLRDYDLVCSDGSMFHEGRACGIKCRVVSFTKQIHQRHLSAVTGVSRDILDRHLEKGCFAHIGKERRRVVWNSAHLKSELSKPRADGTDALTFGYLGRLSEEKGLSTLISAARQCAPGNWRLVIGGRENSYSKDLMRAATDLPVTFLGFVEPAAFLAEVDVLIVPSIWAEPFGRIVVEAYSMGVAVIGSDSGGIPDLVVGGADDWLFPAGDVDALTARMERCISAGRAGLPDRAAFGAVLAATAPEEIARQYAEMYTKVIGGGGRGRE